MDWLKPSGDITDDIINNLFQTYHVASYEELVSYINNKKDSFDYGKYITTKQIIMAELNK